MTDHDDILSGHPGNAPRHALYHPRMFSELPVDCRLLERIRMHNQAHEFTKSRMLYREIIEQPGAPVEIFYHLGRVLNRVCHYEQAHAVLSEALARRPGFAQARSLMGVVCLRLGACKEAREHLLLAVRLEPSDLTAWRRLYLYYHNLNVRELMFDMLKLALKRFPEDEGLHAHLQNLMRGS